MTRRKLGYLPDRADPRDHDLQQLALPNILPYAMSLRDQVKLVLDQGSTQACVAHALAQAISVAEAHVGVHIALPSRLFIYYNSRRQHDDSLLLSDAGTYLRSAAAGLQKLGAPPESEWEFSDSILRVNRRPKFDAYMRAHSRRGGGYYRISGQGASRVQAIKTALCAGLPVAFGTSVSESFLEAHGGVIVDRPTSTERLVGGHAMTIIGYESSPDRSTLFEVVNSWGPGWRDHGFCKLTENYIVWPFTSDLWCVRGWEAVRDAKTPNV
jgi:Papain family cysteine protease